MTRAPHPTGGSWYCGGCSVKLSVANLCEHCHTVLCDDCAKLPHAGVDVAGQIKSCPASPKAPAKAA